jgi:hypothetical protein
MKAIQARTRISLRNILFATDFSPAADATAPFAMQIARSYGAKMCGVHVNPFDDYAAARYKPAVHRICSALFGGWCAEVPAGTMVATPSKARLT